MRLKILVPALAAVLMIGVVSTARAQVLHDDSNYVATDRTIDDDLYVTGKSIQIDGTVNGDVYAAGTSVNIKGTVNGDVIAAGQDVTVSGTVKGSVRAAGSNVRLSGAKVGGSATLAGQNVTLDGGSAIGGAVQFAGSNVRLADGIGRGVVGYGGLVTLAGTVGKDASIYADTLNLDSSAHINGSLLYNTSENINKSNGASVGGETKRVEDRKPDKQNDARDAVMGAIWSLLALMTAGSVLLWLAPVATRGAAMAASAQPLVTFGWGLLITLLALPLFILLLVTTIGIPLAILGVVGFGSGLYLAKFIVALAIGIALSKRAGWKANPYGDALIGLLALTLVGLIPVLGGLVGVVVAMIGLGSIFVYFRTRRAASVPTAKPKST